jgi:hypothetical protein
MEPNRRHRTHNFRVLHECVPHEAGALVLGHQHRDAQVNPEHIRVIPAGKRLNASTKLYLCHAFGNALWILRSTATQSEDRNGIDPLVAQGTMEPSIRNPLSGVQPMENVLPPLSIHGHLMR